MTVWTALVCQSLFVQPTSKVCQCLAAATEVVLATGPMTAVQNSHWMRVFPIRVQPTRPVFQPLPVTRVSVLPAPLEVVVKSTSVRWVACTEERARWPATVRAAGACREGQVPGARRTLTSARRRRVSTAARASRADRRRRCSDPATSVSVAGHSEAPTVSWASVTAYRVRHLLAVSRTTTNNVDTGQRRRLFEISTRRLSPSLANSNKWSKEFRR